MRPTRNAPAFRKVFLSTVFAIFLGAIYLHVSSFDMYRPACAPQIALPTIGHDTAYLTQARHNLSSWKANLFLKTMLYQKELDKQRSADRTHREGFEKFDILSPFITCPEGEQPIRIGGSGDGSKLLCESILSNDPCVVYSMGSKNNFKFEEEILKTTSCEVFTFDCTVDGRKIHERHTFVKKCIGMADRMLKNGSFWWTLERTIKTLQHEQITLLKIDIEGFEFDVLADWKPEQQFLPRQIAMELHAGWLYFGTPYFKLRDDFSNLLWPLHEVTESDIALFLVHLGNLGYGIVSREDSEFLPCCAEFTLLRIGP